MADIHPVTMYEGFCHECDHSVSAAPRKTIEEACDNLRTHDFFVHEEGGKR